MRSNIDVCLVQKYDQLCRLKYVSIGTEIFGKIPRTDWTRAGESEVTEV